jgi:hypothetical protein
VPPTLVVCLGSERVAPIINACVISGWGTSAGSARLQSCRVPALLHLSHSHHASQQHGCTKHVMQNPEGIKDPSATGMPRRASPANGSKKASWACRLCVSPTTPVISSDRRSCSRHAHASFSIGPYASRDGITSDVCHIRRRAHSLDAHGNRMESKGLRCRAFWLRMLQGGAMSAGQDLGTD